MKLSDVAQRLGDFIRHERPRHLGPATVQPSLPTVVEASGDICVYASLASDELLGVIEPRGSYFSITFSGEESEAFRVTSIRAAVDCFVEYKWSRDLGKFPSD